MSNHDQTSVELEEHLREQLDFLERSADAFDSGFESEAKRLAATMRVLLHDTPKSRSVLDQLGRKDGPFVDTAYRRHPRSVGTHCELTVLEMGAATQRYVPMLDATVEQARSEPFTIWWDATVIMDKSPALFATFRRASARWRLGSRMVPKSAERRITPPS